MPLEDNVPDLSESQMRVDITKTTAFVCSCGNHTFTQATLLREISAILSPTGKAALIPVPVFVCNACGAIPDRLIPWFVKEETAKKLEDTPNASRKGNLTLIP